MKRACLAVEQGDSVRRAAIKYSVPRSTLHDRISGKVSMGATSGPERYLNDDEEEELVRFLSGCAKIGYGKSKKQVLCLVEAILMKKRGVPSAPVTKGWWESFQRRHPQLSLRCPETLSYARAIASSRGVIDDYFDLLEETLVRNDLTNKPAQIFNCDESGFPLSPEAIGKLIAVKGQKHFWVNSSTEKAQITVLACASASGYILPPMVIYDRKRLTQELTKNEVPGTIYGLSDKGWINSDLFLQWFELHFLTHAPPARPLLLLLDGHSSHYQPDLVRLAAKAGVILFVLPPNTTHFVQPLDKTVFGPMKVYWWQECQNFMARNPGRVITRNDFNEIFSQAWYRGGTQANILSAFKATGIYPFDRYAVQVPGEDTRKKSLPATTSADIAFLPLYSPAPRRKSCTSNTEKLTSTPSLEFLQCSPPMSPTPSPPDQSFSVSSILNESPLPELDQLSVSSSSESGRSFELPFQGEFTDDEVSRFTIRFENGYDLQHDTRYNTWKQLYHPESSDLSSQPSSSQPSSSQQFTTVLKQGSHKSARSQIVDKPKESQVPKHSTSVVTSNNGTKADSLFLSELLKVPTPPAKLKRPTGRAKVLTSADHMKFMEEKEREKEMKRLEKETRKQQREERKLAKVKAKEKQQAKAKEKQQSKAKGKQQAKAKGKQQSKVKAKQKQNRCTPILQDHSLAVTGTCMCLYLCGI